jgi:hypothetical protein
MEQMEKETGLGKNEGLIASACYLGFCLVALIGLRKKIGLLISFIVLIGTFHAIYAKRLCSVCEKLCPVNPSKNFWKEYF